jgi:hypothetical protein
MKAFRLAVLMLIFVVFILAQAFAADEVFKVETSGTEYCGDYNSVKFNAKNNIDLWVHLLSKTEIIVSFTPNFESGTTFPMHGQTYLTGKNKGAFVGGVLFEDLSYITLQGTVIFDKFGTVKKMSGTFIQNGLFDLSCFSSGTFKTMERLQ